MRSAITKCGFWMTTSCRNGANTTDLSDLFANIQLVSAGMTNGSFQFSVTNVLCGRTSYV